MTTVAGQIAERAAIPKEIIVLDKLPLTDVGKPMKPALWRDIAERTFRSVLRTAIGASCDDGKLKLSVIAHPSKGDLLTIDIGATPTDDRHALAVRIEETMRPYAYPYTIEQTAMEPTKPRGKEAR